MNFHGINGEAKVGYTKGQEDFLTSLKNVLVKSGEEYLPFKLKSVKFTSKNAIFKLDGINSINELLPYKGCIIYADKDEAEKTLKAGEYLADNLIGMDVQIEGKRVGSITGVSTNGAQNLLSVKTLSQKIVLIPFVDAIVKEVNEKQRKVIVENLKGLIDE